MTNQLLHFSSWMSTEHLKLNMAHQKLFHFYLQKCSFTSFPVSLCPIPSYLVGASQKSWHHLFFVCLIMSLYIQSSRSTSKTYTKPATSFHDHPSPQHLHLPSKLLEEFPGWSPLIFLWLPYNLFITQQLETTFLKCKLSNIAVLLDCSFSSHSQWSLNTSSWLTQPVDLVPPASPPSTYNT